MYFITESLFKSYAIRYGVYDGQVGTATGFSPSTSSYLYTHHIINVIHVSPKLFNLSNF